MRASARPFRITAPAALRSIRFRTSTSSTRWAAATATGTADYQFPVAPFEPVIKPAVPKSPHEPGDEGVRLERLKTIAALRDSGALTEEEFEAEKRRILEGR